jgi:hypothetical protein
LARQPQQILPMTPRSADTLMVCTLCFISYFESFCKKVKWMVLSRLKKGLVNPWKKFWVVLKHWFMLYATNAKRRQLQLVIIKLKMRYKCILDIILANFSIQSMPLREFGIFSYKKVKICYFLYVLSFESNISTLMKHIINNTI